MRRGPIDLEIFYYRPTLTVVLIDEYDLELIDEYDLKLSY
ncbi:hypothetical protein CASFOL_012841 [Castilleja foliolosa]|uniref:Uncharacterized protein n=1 Tax=Castilleja foliolosa TaxID=1961234 RepID=A0ABD3DMA8_9LAMI